MTDLDGEAAVMAIEQRDGWSDDGLQPDGLSLDRLAAESFHDRTARHMAGVRRLGECEDGLIAAAEMVTQSLCAGHTIFTLGNGGSAAEAQHFAAELVGRFRRQRRAFPVLALTTDSSILTAVANDFSYADVFARQVEAFAHAGDVLVAFSTSGESENAIRAAHAARMRGAAVIAMTGERVSSLGEIADIVVQAPSGDTPTIQELHSLFTHVLCDVAESTITRQEGVRPA